ncbi:tail fiber protein [Galbibacter sp. EGI 63066]|uniref:tail fiber protein n=1 Tax=Galbibacter sp. EGI 63066 TaxID=2993559 RepID=UPI0022492B08|nr:tail fiber protein [Galbibacter sp. EGI 63066]MCX2680630.1 tail fiber protein [Galbibacter sp. EGI 63066]
MRRNHLLLSLFLMPLFVFSQTNTFPDSGNVGIGTNNPNSILSLYLPPATASYPSLTSSGDIVQSIRTSNNELEIGNSRGFNDRKSWILSRHASEETYGQYYSSLHLQPDVGVKSQYRGVAIGYLASQAIPVGVHLAVNGKVGIGTLNPDSELAVKGNIHAREVKVDLNGAVAPDYVFKEDYELKTLEEVQMFIQSEGHLPNIPSAKEMEEEGIHLKEMNLKLLEKIEELTLYAIEQHKQNDQQNKFIKALLSRLEKLEKQNIELSEQIESIKKKIK